MGICSTGTARHDAVNWGYAKLPRLVDIIQNCEVTGFIRQAGNLVGIGQHKRDQAEKIGMAVAGHTSVLAEKVGLVIYRKPQMRSYLSFEAVS